MKRHGRSRPRIVAAEGAGCGAEAAAVIGCGGIAAIPTETSYGLAVDPFAPGALERLFHLKRRPPTKPVLVLVEEVGGLGPVARDIPPAYLPLIEKHWPGPLTLVFPARPGLPVLLTGGTDTVGVRVSSNPTATEICRRVGGPITATSANVSSQEPARSASDVAEIFGDRLDIIVDGGLLASGPCSTIVGLTEKGVTVIREGAVRVGAEPDGEG